MDCMAAAEPSLLLVISCWAAGLAVDCIGIFICIGADEPEEFCICVFTCWDCACEVACDWACDAPCVTACDWACEFDCERPSTSDCAWERSCAGSGKFKQDMRKTDTTASKNVLRINTPIPC